MKKILKLTAIAFLFILSFSCEKDDSELNIESTIEQEKITESNLKSRLFVPTTCDITGSAVIIAGSTVTYYYTNDTGTSNNIAWTLLPAGSGNLTQNGSNSVTIVFNSNFTSGILLAAGTGGTALNCTAQMNISTGIIPPPSCSCPVPVIDDVLCVSGGHPHWRFEVNGINSSDQITWSINHGTIHSNPNQSYVIIEPNSGSTHGFTVYCEIERTCSDGSKKTRKAYYTNYYGNSCGTGTTGYVGRCSGGSMIDH